MAKFKTIVTTVGAAKIAAVLAGTGSIVLDSKARMAVGDGNGTLPTPVPSQTALVHEVYRGALNSVSIDDSDPKNIVVELVIPPDKGGFWMREMALYDAAGTLLAVGNMAETYKPSLSEGAGRKSVIRMVIAVSDVSAVTITIDSSTVMATKEYVDDKIDEHEKSRNHPDATLTAKGFTQLNSSTNSASETQAATPKAVKTVMDATNLKAPLNSPTLTGIPLAPTAAPSVNNTQIATTAFVRAAITALINASPAPLDTLGELAAAIGNDANFAVTMANALAAKAPLASPVLTGTPQAPTAAAGNNTQQLATTAFVQAAVTRLINSSPEALDTLKELADALGNDANFATTMTNALAGKQPKDTTLTNLSGKDVAGLLQYLGLSVFTHDTITSWMKSPNGVYGVNVNNSGEWGCGKLSEGGFNPLGINGGGTGADTAPRARSNLGLGGVSTEDIVPLSKGGTGATDAVGARSKLGLGGVSTEDIVPLSKGGTGATSAVNARANLTVPKGVDGQVASAWTSFEIQNGNVVGNEGHNIANITRLSTGSYRINFATPLVSAGYAVCGTVSDSTSDGALTISLNNASGNIVRLVTGFEITTRDSSDNTLRDSSLICIHVFGGI